jgi:hypothetical protein
MHKPGISILNVADLGVSHELLAVSSSLSTPELSGMSDLPSSLSAGISPELSAMTSSLSELGGFSVKINISTIR